MSETSDMLVASGTRLFETRLSEDAARASRQGLLSASGWAAVEEAGLPLALLSEADGGFGVAAADALDLIRIGGYFASPVPLGETMFANHLLARAGLPLAEGPATMAIFAPADAAQHIWTASNVPWARHANIIVGIAGDRVIRLTGSDVGIAPAFSACGLPRDVVSLEESGAAAQGVLPAGSDGDALRAMGALLRSLEMAGALRRLVEMTVEYAGERVQFGRPIARQQAIQQQLATLAAQAAAANAAADFAACAFGTADGMMAAAVAKSRIGEAAGIAAAIAHQVHGAIGFTEEHRLHLFTRALWAWRDEFGGEAYWQAKIGSAALAQGAHGYWPFVTSIQPQRVDA